MAAIKTSIVVSMYNAKPRVLEIVDKLFFPSLVNNASKDKEFVLLDDASPLRRETRELVGKYRPALEESFGDFTYVENQENLGFAGSYNKGTRLARGSAVMIANDDVYFPRGSVDSLVSVLESDEKIGAVGPVVDGWPWGFQGTRFFRGVRGISLKELEKVEKFAGQLRRIMLGRFYQVGFLAAYCLVLRRRILEEVGYFDVDYKYGLYEDMDLNFRVVRDGYHIVLDASTFVKHGGPAGGSTSLRQHTWKMIRSGIINAVRLYVKGYQPQLREPLWMRLSGLCRVSFVDQHIIEEAKLRGLWEVFQSQSWLMG